MATVQITSARVLTDEGRLAALVDLVDIGGGTQVVTVDGSPEVRTHPASTVFHARLVSPDIMIPDQLHECATYDDAISLGETYAGKLSAHAADIAALADDLRID